MAHLRFLRSPALLAATAAAALMLPSLAQASLTTHTTEAAWQSAVSSPTLIDFDGLADGTVLSNQYAGLSFSAFHSGNPLAAAYGGSYSGVNVLSLGTPPLTGGGGGVAIDFAAPQGGVAFWYLDSQFAGNLVTVYGAASTVLGIYEMAYPHPGEWLFVGFGSSTNDITRIDVSIDAADAVSLDNLLVASVVPEPSSAAMLLLGGLFVLRGARRRAAPPVPDPSGAAHDCAAEGRPGSRPLASGGVAP
jgi:hypothetical protein